MLVNSTMSTAIIRFLFGECSHHLSFEYRFFVHKRDATDSTIDERLLYWQTGHRNTRGDTPPRFICYLSFETIISKETVRTSLQLRDSFLSDSSFIAFFAIKHRMNSMLKSHWNHRNVMNYWIWFEDCLLVTIKDMTE